MYARDLKSVRSVHPFAVSRPVSSSAGESSSSAARTTNPANVTEGDTVDLCLMQRSSKSTLALPLSDTWPISDDLYNKHQKRGDATSLTLMPWHFTPNVMLFGRFMLASPDYLLMENDRDIRELKTALKDAKDWGSAEDIPFIEAGLQQLGLEAEAIGSMFTNKTLENAVQSAEHLLDQAKASQPHHPHQNEKTSTTSEAIHEHPPAIVDENDIPEAYRQHHLQRAGTDDFSSLATATNGSNTTVNPQKQQQQQQHQQQHQLQRQSPTNEFYFYQAKDGQHIYLHPLDIRILKYEYGDYQNFPPLLQVKTRGVEETTLTEVRIEKMTLQYVALLIFLLLE